eukprot:15345018-Heterocapsa_arctica.AAC.1
MYGPFTPETPGCAEPPGELRGARRTAAGSMPTAERQAGKQWPDRSSTLLYGPLNTEALASTSSATAPTW